MVPVSGVLTWKEYPGSTNDEVIAFTYESLQLQMKDIYEKPVYRLTGTHSTTLGIAVAQCLDFTLYDAERHLVALDGPLLANDLPVFFCGTIKALYDDDPLPHSGPKVCDIQVTGWDTVGLDKGSKPTIYVATLNADYYLLSPSQQYKDIMKRFHL